MEVRVFSYRYSVYSRIVHMVLHLKQIPYEVVETDPFTDLTEAHLARHPFDRVPVLQHGDFSLYETGAISRYLDRSFPGASLQPKDPAALAQMDQVIAIIDSYGYVPMVRQVFSHSVFRPLAGAEADPQVIAEGLASSRPVLAALEELVREGRVLNREELTLADCHLAPMLDYFQRARAGRELLAGYPDLARWWSWMSEQEALSATDPDLSALGDVDTLK